ncbi:hypothetical protein DID96_35205 [Burkholderia sp. Bp8963]|uniref:hypothetical protein n=1 Tax=Burkholderia sp. Bp8963 TaxID=2184547 RepID=UPI000F5B72F8|nr:hypothetical protein [Burkholderia sp. Bp8963]RQS59704.1 hypothetical protein DID96_35205 [Burkholderia sp. Bp8963]
MRIKTDRADNAGKYQKRLMRALAVAIDKGLKQSLDAMTPRAYVEIRTTSPFELGLRLKRMLRDELYERHREESKRASADEMEESK